MISFIKNAFSKAFGWVTAEEKLYVGDQVVLVCTAYTTRGYPVAAGNKGTIHSISRNGTLVSLLLEDRFFDCYITTSQHSVSLLSSKNTRE